MKPSPFVTHLECSATGEHLVADQPWGLSPGGAPILVRYDLDAVADAMTKDVLTTRPADMWRWTELLPVPVGQAPVSLGEIETPLIRLARWPMKAARGANLVVKDEGRLPTGTFKARGLAVAVTLAKSFGIDSLAIPTAGNAGAAMAAYAARAGMRSYVFAPADAPPVTLAEIAFQGADLTLVDGIIADCGRVVGSGTEHMRWFDMSTLKEPYRIEGKKTMGLELARQLDWQLPEVIFYPTGGGTGLIGMWKGFQELRTMGLIDGPLPRMVAVQSTRCGPIVKAFDAGADHVAEAWAPVETTLHGVRVPKPIGDRLILDAIYQSDGFAVAVDDDEAEAARAEATALDGLHLGPEGAACALAWKMSVAAGRIDRDARAVIFNCGSGLKSPMPLVSGTGLNPNVAVDWRAFAANRS